MRPPRLNWKYPIAVVVIGGAVAFVTLNSWANARVKGALGELTGSPGQARATPDHQTTASRSPTHHWDGLIRVEPSQRAGLGLEVVEVHPQVQPMELAIHGSTDYVLDTLTQIRPKFLIRVDKVDVSLGERVEKGQPLIEVSSADLAQAKGDYGEKKSQWEHDKAQLTRSEKLFHQKAMSEKDYFDDVKDEQVSGREFQKTHDKLVIDYGLTETQIDQIKDQPAEFRPKMTIRSPVSGYIIKRDVVSDNLYDIASVLLVISPLDKFWVWGNVYPSDAALIRKGQAWNVDCAFLGACLPRTVEVISPQVDPDTKTIRIRTTIDNQDGRVRADMLVSGTLEIPPDPGATVIPRVSMIVADGADYVFIQKEGTTDQFERRLIQAAREAHDHVVVREGLKPGELVVARGSLIMAQMYEDASTADTGTPLY